MADFSYDSFGRPATGGATPDALDFLFGYAGGIYDPETGNQYHQARYYDSALGRFLGEDPGSFAGGDANFYRYAQGDPVNQSDPEGLMARLLGGGSLGGAAASAANRAFFSSLGQAPASSPPSSFGSTFSDVNPLLYGDLDYRGAQPVTSTPSGSLSPSFNFGTTISSTIASGNYSFVGGASRSLITSASQPIRIPLTEQQGRAMRDQEQIQQLLSEGVTVYGLQTAEGRRAATGAAWGGEGLAGWATATFYEANYSLGRVFGDSQRFPEIEPESLRAVRTAQDISNTTAAVALTVSGALSARGSVARPATGFVPLAAVEASAARLRLGAGTSRWDLTHPLIEGVVDANRSWEHTFLQQTVAEEAVASGAYQRVGMGRRLSEFSGMKHKPDIRADIMGLSTEGRIDLIEIRSSTQSIPRLERKLLRAQDQLPPEMRGGIRVIDPMDAHR